MITERELLDRMNSSLNNQKIQTAQIDRPPEVLQPPSVALAREFFERDYEPQDAADDITEREKVKVPDFDGRLDPAVFDDWFSAIEEYFD